MQQSKNESRRTGNLTRRSFLQTAAVTTAAATAGRIARAAEVRANETLGVGFIGVGGRGGSHVKAVQDLIKEGQKLKIVAVCDAYGPRMRAHAAATKAKAYGKHHDVLADKDVDIVCIASPDRLHLPQGIDAVRAGKDVYIEKPMGHWSQIAEAKLFRDEALKNGRVVQVGTQGTSSAVWDEVGELIRKGAIGRPRHVAAGYYRNGDWGERMHIPDKNAKPGPDLDWEAFLGDAPKVPFTVERFFSWRMFLDYAGGPSTDLLPHVFTPFVRMLGLGCPSLATGSGGIYQYTDYGREVPDTFNMCLEYPEKLSVVLVCTLANDYTTGPCIRGDEGALTFDVGSWEQGCRNVKIQPQSHGKGAGKKVQQVELKTAKIGSTEEHWRDFLNCVRTREKPKSNVEFGYSIHVALAMAMQGFLKKEVAKFDAKSDQVTF
ncbi:MAG: Gfo/Idh/MocA family oxidoreductase [Phycisphaerae bacterium]|nr:Gfo/Idh/MocA family oxidoreductase [Phycisphaerae bacterium]